MADTIQVYGQTFSDVTGVKLTDDNNQQIRLIKPAGTISINSNGTVDVAAYASATVAVPQPSGSTSIGISANGTTSHNVSAFETAEIITNVPNTYTAGDEGKVVQSGALVSQGSSTFYANDTYDTTYLDSVTVAVSGQSGITVSPLSVYANGTYTAPSGTAYSPVTVDVQLSAEPEEKDVNFIDYDGTLLYSYSKADFLALTAMPANPSHTGLTAQGWNWTLADAQTFVNTYGGLCIGQYYVTDDGATRLILKPVGANTLIQFHIACTNTAVTIDWGDGTTPDTTTRNFAGVVSHTYQNAGKYTISITKSESNGSYKTDYLRNYNIVGYLEEFQCSTGWFSEYEAFKGCVNLERVSVTSSTQLGQINGGIFNDTAITGVVGNIALADSVFKGSRNLRYVSTTSTYFSGNGSFFENCYSLRGTSLKSLSSTPSVIDRPYSIFKNCKQFTESPFPITIFVSNLFSGCSSLKKVEFGTYSSGRGDNMFQDCWSLEEAILPEGLTTLGNNTFNGCKSMTRVVFPSTFTSLTYSGTFYTCSSCQLFDFRSVQQVVTLAAAGYNTVFSNIDANCKFVVPDSLYSDWVADSKWRTIASQIISASDYANL